MWERKKRDLVHVYDYFGGLTKHERGGLKVRIGSSEIQTVYLTMRHVRKCRDSRVWWLCKGLAVPFLFLVLNNSLLSKNMVGPIENKAQTIIVEFSLSLLC